MGIPTPAGNDKILGKTNPPAVPAGGFFLVVKPAVNTLATAFD
jgi:hypothetical protein